MRTEEARPVRLSEYRPPDWLVETVHLDVSLDPTRTRVRAKLKLKPNPASRGPCPAGARRRWAHVKRAQARWRSARGRALCRHARRTDHCAAAAAAVRAGNRNAGRSHGQHPAQRPLPIVQHLLHPVRGRRLSPHHLFPRPARRDGGLHHPHRSGQSRSSGSACRTAIWWHRAMSPAPRGISRSGTIRSQNLRICSRWWAACSACVEDQLRHHVRPRGGACASTSSPARRRAAPGRWNRSSAPCAGTRRPSAANTISTCS